MNYYTKDDLCVMCVTQLIFGGPNQGHIKPSGEVDAAKWHEMNSYLRGMNLKDIVKALLWAFNGDHEVWINGQPYWPETMTLNGTKLCAMHLMDAYQRYNSPRQVRMAQWR